MREIVIFGDSTCDLGKDIRDKYGLDYVPMNYVLEGKEYKASLDWEAMSVKDFYNCMREGKTITTTQVPRQVFEASFRQALEQGKDIIYISCSGVLSGSIGQASIIAKELLEEYPDAKIRCVDSLNSSFGQGIEMMWASEMRAKGYNVDEIADRIEADRLKVHQVAFPEKLSYLKKAGRVTASSAFFGNIIGIKPILISDAKGQNYALKKVKGMKAAIAELVNMVADEIRDAQDQIVYISHADAEETANILREQILEKTKCKDVVYGYIGPIVGASVGPGTVAAYFVGDEVTMIGEA